MISYSYTVPAQISGFDGSKYSSQIVCIFYILPLTVSLYGGKSECDPLTHQVDDGNFAHDVWFTRCHVKYVFFCHSLRSIIVTGSI